MEIEGCKSKLNSQSLLFLRDICYILFKVTRGLPQRPCNKIPDPVLIFLRLLESICLSASSMAEIVVHLKGCLMVRSLRIASGPEHHKYNSHTIMIENELHSTLKLLDPT